MHDFALVTEGPTDHAILKNILLGYFKNQREPAIHREHPDPQVEADGGWTLLLRYLRNKKFRQAFQLNRFLIIQVDTDISQESGFDVPHQDENGPLPVAGLVERVIERLRREIGEPDCTTYAGRFIFAIAVHQIECWVLPLWFSDAHAEKIAGCIAALGGCPNLRERLTQKKFRWIRAEEKDVRSYDEASRDYRKTQALHNQGRRNPSLALFLVT
jgi:hypothetical protein